jgi:plasmid replication initiation protein
MGHPKKNNLVVKDNALIDASYNLDLVEQRLILLAIIEARETGKGVTHDTLLEVHASSYINQFHVEKHTAYKVLREAAKTLFNRYVTYHDINPNTGKDRSFHVRWVDKVGYEQDSGLVYLRFSQDVVPLITRLEENFTSYEIQQISNLSSAYAVRLYELLIKWRSVGQTPIFDLATFRKQVGVLENEYAQMSDFKKWVLHFAINQINEHTDITVSYEQHKAGRIITGFTFSLKQKKLPKDVTPKVKPKPKTTKNTNEDNIDALLKNDDWVKKHAKVGESWSDARSRLKNEAETGKFTLT